MRYPFTREARVILLRVWGLDGLPRAWAVGISASFWKTEGYPGSTVSPPPFLFIFNIVKTLSEICGSEQSQMS